MLAGLTLTLKTVIDLAKTLESAHVELKSIKKEIIAENTFTSKQKSERCYWWNSDEHLANMSF